LLSVEEENNQILSKNGFKLISPSMYGPVTLKYTGE